MVFARDPLLFHQYYDKELQGFLSKQGFGGYVFWNQPVAIYQGSDCYYPSEQEVFARRAVKGSQQNKISPNSISSLSIQQPLVNSNVLLQQQQQNIAQSQLLTSQQQSALLNARQQVALLSATQRAQSPVLQQNGSPLLNLQQSSLISNQQQSPLSSLDLNSQHQQQLQQEQQQQRPVIPVQSLSSIQQLQNLAPLSLAGNRKQ